MNSVSEIETALRQLPPQERWEIARWLLENLQELNLDHPEGQGSNNGGSTPPPPDYSARRRRIFGGKVLPNMVLVARAEEPW